MLPEDVDMEFVAPRGVILRFPEGMDENEAREVLTRVHRILGPYEGEYFKGTIGGGEDEDGRRIPGREVYSDMFDGGAINNEGKVEVEEGGDGEEWEGDYGDDAIAEDRALDRGQDSEDLLEGAPPSQTQFSLTEDDIRSVREGMSPAAPDVGLSQDLEYRGPPQPPAYRQRRGRGGHEFRGRR